MVEEIIQRTKMEEELRRSEGKYRTLVEANPYGIHEIDKSGVITYTNPAYQKMLGYSKEELLGRSIIDLLDPTSRQDELREYLSAMLKGQQQPAIYSQKSRTKDGSVIDTEVCWNHIRDNKGGVVGFVSVITDITQRMKAEEALKRSEERFRTIFETTREGIITTDADGRISSANPATAAILGYESVNELVGRHGIEIWFDPEQRGLVLKEALSTGYMENFEVTLRKKDGTPVYVLATANVYMDDKGNVTGTEAFLKDITERERMEEQLQHSQLLASLGEMTAGIAHEVGNPLASILLVSELLTKSDIPQQAKRDLRMIQYEAKRAGKIMRDLLVYSHKAALYRHRLNLHSILKKVLDMRRYEETVQNIKVSTNLLKNPLYVYGEASQLRQVFMNLVLNAEEVLKERKGGNIVVTTEIDGEWAWVSIADDGDGIAEENLSRVFHPFFTTKQVGEGTGLGLSICYGIITGHGGLIHVENNEMGGATFTVQLPLAEKGRQGTLPLGVETANSQRYD